MSKKICSTVYHCSVCVSIVSDFRQLLDSIVRRSKYVMVKANMGEIVESTHWWYYYGGVGKIGVFCLFSERGWDKFFNNF